MSTTRRKGVDTLKNRARRTFGPGNFFSYDRPICYLIYSQISINFRSTLTKTKKSQDSDHQNVGYKNDFRKISMFKKNRKVFIHTEVILDLDSFLSTWTKLKFFFVWFILMKLIDHYSRIAVSTWIRIVLGKLFFEGCYIIVLMYFF